MKGTSHNVANLMVYMPNEKLVYWGDGYNPPEGNDPRDFGAHPRADDRPLPGHHREQSRREDDRARARRRSEALRQSEEGDRIDRAVTAPRLGTSNAGFRAEGPPLRISHPAVPMAARRAIL